MPQKGTKSTKVFGFRRAQLYLTICAFCAFLWLYNVGEALAGAGEPPVAEEEEDEGEGGEVGETTPVGGGAVEKDMAIAADQ